MHLILSPSLKSLRIEWYWENKHVQRVGRGALYGTGGDVGEYPDRKVKRLCERKLLFWNLVHSKGMFVIEAF